jgi:hypothetical protein
MAITHWKSRQAVLRRLAVPTLTVTSLFEKWQNYLCQKPVPLEEEKPMLDLDLHPKDPSLLSRHMPFRSSWPNKDRLLEVAEEALAEVDPPWLLPWIHAMSPILTGDCVERVCA